MYYVNPMFSTRQTPALRGMGAMGASTDVQVDTADILNLGQQLRDAQAHLTTLFQSMQASPSVALAIGRDVTAQQQKLGDLISRYVYVHTAVFGQAPVGLGNPVLVAAAVAVILAYVGANLYLWWQKQNVLESQAQAAILAEQNRAAIIDMAQQKQTSADQKAAAGDAAGAAADQAAADQILQQAGIPGATAPAPPAGGTFSDWIKANWIPVAGIGAAVFFFMQQR